MTFRGRIENGVVRFDGPVNLPDGTEVDVQAVRHARRSPATTNGKPKSAAKSKRRSKRSPSPYQALKPFIGVVDDMPRDFARNHDRYIHGS